MNVVNVATGKEAKVMTITFRDPENKYIKVLNTKRRKSL